MVVVFPVAWCGSSVQLSEGSPVQLRGGRNSILEALGCFKASESYDSGDGSRAAIRLVAQGWLKKASSFGMLA